jgi:riboflavin kinase, archaea type
MTFRIIVGLSVTRVYRCPLPYSTCVTSLDGVVTSGLGQGAHFMSLPWVRGAVRQLVGFTPYPGTLNVRLDAGAVLVWRRLQEHHGIVLAPPPSEPCGARLFPVVVTPDVEAAVIVPDVTRYGEDLLELIAPVHLRSRLGLHDESRVTLRFG